MPVFARFCKTMQPQAWELEPLEIRELRALGRRRNELLAMRTQESNRARLNPESVEKSIESMLASIEKAIQEIEQKIKVPIDSHPGLKKQFALLQSIPGIGAVCAEAILSETGGFSRFAHAREAVAYASLSPHERSSGTSLRGHASFSKRGNSRLRRMLYIPSLIAQWADPLETALAQRLQEKGKAAKVLLCACMKKLLQIAFGVLKHGKKFDPNYEPQTAIP